MVLSVLYRQNIEFYKQFAVLLFGFAILFAGIDWNQPVNDKNHTKYFRYGDLNHKTVVEKVSNYLYLSMTTLTTIGLGDITPMHPVTQAVIGAQALCTFAMITTLVSK